MDSKIIVVWHGHSCFTLSADGYTLRWILMTTVWTDMRRCS